MEFTPPEAAWYTWNSTGLKICPGRPTTVVVWEDVWRMCGVCVSVSVCGSSRWWSLAGCVQGSKSSPWCTSHLIQRNRKDRCSCCVIGSPWSCHDNPSPILPPRLLPSSPIPPPIPQWSPQMSCAQTGEMAHEYLCYGISLLPCWPLPLSYAVLRLSFTAVSSLLSLRLICLLSNQCVCVCVYMCVCVCM